MKRSPYLALAAVLLAALLGPAATDGPARAVTQDGPGLEPATDAIARAERHLLTKIGTDDPAFTAFVRTLLRRTLLDKIWEPIPPGLPYRWFSITGRDDDSYGKCQLLWDTMFVLNAYAALDDDVLIRDVFRNYWAAIDHNVEAPKGSFRYGMVPCVINPTLPPVGFSQTPTLAWGVLMVYRQTHDRALLKESLPYLLAFDHWYSTERDVDDDGLIEQGAYKAATIANLLQTAKYESFDFHPAVDGMKLTRHPRRPGSGEWYGDIEGVDTTCALLIAERATAEIARELGREDVARELERTIARRVAAIQARMWDPGTKFFYSVNRDTHEKIRVRTIQAFWTLTAGAATPEQAGALVGQLKDPKQWWARFPIPTVAMDDPEFRARGFWRGDMWPPTNYLVALGLIRNGYHDVARDLTEKMLTLLAEKGINERYDATNGDPLGVGDYCWTALVWNMAVQARYGVQEDYRTIRVPSDAVGRRLKLGKLEVAYPREGVVEVKTDFARRFRVVFPTGSGEATVTRDGRRLGKIGREAFGTESGVAFDAVPGKVYRVSARGMRSVTTPTKSAVAASGADEGRPLLGNRFLTLATVVRVRQVEMTRDEAGGPDESAVHTPAEAKLFRDTIARAWPSAKITWAFSWRALNDQRPNYRDLRDLVVSYHRHYGDEVTFVPGGFFANMYNTRDQVNRDLHDGLRLVSEMVGGGYRPRCVIAGFLAADNLRYLAEQEDIHVCQGNIWSQHAVDNGDGDGSISYPYYPSREHFLKPAQGREDLIDCVNLDGWTCDFLTARRAGQEGGARSRSGVGPIETLLAHGTEKGLEEMLATTAAHFDDGFERNSFAWVTCIWELVLVEGRRIYGYGGRNGMDGLERWLSEIRRRWPEARCITHGEFGLLWRKQFKDNASLDYRFVQRGTGFPGSERDKRIRWFMNKDFRLALLGDWGREDSEKVIDFTRYDSRAQEPPDPRPGEHIRNWSLMNRLNQKGLRPVDRPVPFSQLTVEEREFITRRCPELKTGPASRAGFR
jgi:hypothetical protein